MRELEALAGSCKNHGVLTDYLAFANGLNRYFILNFLHAFQNLSERFGCAAGRIFF